jgi:hemerythrin-like domain-containing protein
MTMRELPPAIGVLVAEHDICRQHLKATSSTFMQSVSKEMQVTYATFDQAWALLEYLEGDLETHIAKEELPLFPRLKAALSVDDRLIDEMVAEHDLIRIKRSDVRTVLADLLETHDGLRLDRESLRATLAGSVQPRVSLPRIQRAVDIIAAKLRVHFENEEELVFPLAPDLLSSEELDRVATEMAAIGNAAAAPRDAREMR